MDSDLVKALEGLELAVELATKRFSAIPTSVDVRVDVTCEFPDPAGKCSRYLSLRWTDDLKPQFAIVFEDGAIERLLQDYRVWLRIRMVKYIPKLFDIAVKNQVEFVHEMEHSTEQLYSFLEDINGAMHS